MGALLTLAFPYLLAQGADWEGSAAEVGISVSLKNCIFKCEMAFEQFLFQKMFIAISYNGKIDIKIKDTRTPFWLI